MRRSPFNPSEYPLANELRDKISMQYRFEPVPSAGHFVTDLPPFEQARLQAQFDT